jgi:uncharacterized protein YdeI (YjbR/CyaY-like superfamily)
MTKIYEFEILDYNTLKSYGKIKFKEVSQIKEWLDEHNELTAMAWLSFESKTMWVTTYGKFGQR